MYTKKCDSKIDTEDYTIFFFKAITHTGDLFKLGFSFTIHSFYSLLKKKKSPSIWYM